MRIAIPPTAAPTPMPALAPVLRLLPVDGDWVLVGVLLVVVVGGTEMLDAWLLDCVDEDVVDIDVEEEVTA